MESSGEKLFASDSVDEERLRQPVGDVRDDHQAVRLRDARIGGTHGSKLILPRILTNSGRRPSVSTASTQHPASSRLCGADHRNHQSLRRKQSQLFMSECSTPARRSTPAVNEAWWRLHDEYSPEEIAGTGVDPERNQKASARLRPKSTSACGRRHGLHRRTSWQRSKWIDINKTRHKDRQFFTARPLTA